MNHDACQKRIDQLEAELNEANGEIDVLEARLHEIEVEYFRMIADRSYVSE